MRRVVRAPGLLLVALLLTACSTGGAPAPAARLDTPPRLTLPASPLTSDQQILHVLDRLGYGPRPGDLERVRRMGLATHLHSQLHPEDLSDEAVERRLLEYPTLTMGTADLLRTYPRPAANVVQRFQSGAMTQQEMLATYPPERRPFRITAELQAAKLVRAMESQRQLQEVMVDFWLNHFNVSAQKATVRWLVTSYERDAIRPHALGRFRDLLAATARHPAMLFYLDNWVSVRPDFVPTRGPNAGRRTGLNENYARELMELHTLGVDGGYTQQDVIEVARCFTGWSIDRPQEQGVFVFRLATHDAGEKRVLGHVIPAGGGERDGEAVIDILARHPSTARFVATKLIRRFVSDAPPPALVERAAGVFRETDGDIRAVLTAIFTSPEFFSVEAYRAKVKTPLELVVSTARALNAELTAARETPSLPVVAPDAPAATAPPATGAFALARAVAGIGQPLYEAQAPTGYPDDADAWVNSGALVARMNFALRLAQNRVPGVRVDLDRLAAGADRGRPDQVLDRLVERLLHSRSTDSTRAVLASQIGDPQITRRTANDRGRSATDVAKLAALVLGSPDFQRR